MDKNLTWMHIAVPYGTTSINSVQLFYLNEKHLIPHISSLGEITLRQVYEELKPEHYAFINNPADLTQRMFLGRFATLQEAKDKVQSEVEEILKECEL